MRLSELQNKEIIDITTGKRIGLIIDIMIDLGGKINSFVLEDKRLSRRFMASNREDMIISWNKIMKIGDDIILVDMNKN